MNKDEFFKKVNDLSYNEYNWKSSDYEKAKVLMIVKKEFYNLYQN